MLDETRKLAAAFILCLAGGAGLSMVSCEKEGPIEKIGEEIDEVGEEIGDALD